MKTYDPYSIIAIPFPFTDSSKSKKRPAVVISSPAFQEKTKHITLLMVTSAKHSKWHGDHEIADLKSAGIKAASIVRQKIFTIDMRLIHKPIGELGKKDQSEVKGQLAKHILQ